MSKNIASPKQTGGGGFDFENRVAAYYLASLLSEQPPLDPKLGIISRIDFQTRVDGWYLDDVLLTLSDNASTKQSIVLLWLPPLNCLNALRLSH